METIKRPLEEDAMTPSPLPKRRVLSSGDGSPVPVVADNHDIDVELFQKEALWRQMKQYSRDKERAERKVLELQRKQEASEAAMAAVEATWSELLNVVQEHVGSGSEKYKPESLLRFDRYATMESVATQFKSQLVERANTTVALVDELAKSQVKLETEAERSWQQNARRAREEVEVKNAEMQMLKNRLQRVEADIERYKEELSQAEKRVDRSHSRTVRAMESKGTKVEQEEPPAKEDTPVEAKSKEEPQDVAMEPAAPLTNGHVPEVQQENWELRARQREDDLKKASEERLRLYEEIRKLNTQLAFPSESIITSSHSYLTLLQEAQEYKQQCEEAQAFTKPLLERLEKLIAEQGDFKRQTEDAAKKRTADLELTIEKRQHDLARLREKWDALHAEKEMLKSRDVEKLKSVNELKTLVSSCEQRISVLQSEVKRLRTRLAAQEGDSDLLAFLIGSGPGAFSQEETTKQLLEARKKIETLESQLSLDQQSIQATLEKARKYDALFGPEATAAPDVQTLAATLAAKEEELRKAKLRMQNDEETADALYSEIDRVTAAWDTLEKQNKSKAFDLVELEERARRLASEKAQEQSKYYAEKKSQREASVQHEAALRTNQKQKHVIERHEETEKNLEQQLVQQQLTVSKLNATLHDMRKRFLSQESDLMRVKNMAADQNRRNDQLDSQLRAGRSAYESKTLELRQAHEELTVIKEEAERSALKMKETPMVTSSAGPAVQALADENKKLKDILKCSTCHNDFRSQILLKCYHTFCKECIDARLKSRQRKCPVCGLAFAQSDVQTFYFQ